MSFLEKPKAQIFYDLLGDSGPVLTLVNGHTRSSGDFRIFSRTVVEAGYRALLIDNRGSGRSTANDGFTLQDMADDVVDIWRTERIESAFLLGISMGGFIAQFIAAQHPEQVRALILVSTCANKKWMQQTPGAWSESEEDVSAKLGAYFAPAFVTRNEPLFKAMVKQTLEAVKSGRFTERAELQRVAVKKFDNENVIRQIKAPTLILHGDEDKIILVDAARDMASAIATARLDILAGIGHLLLAECPKVLASKVIAFLDSESSR